MKISSRLFTKLTLLRKQTGKTCNVDRGYNYEVVLTIINVSPESKSQFQFTDLLQQNQSKV